MGLEFVLRLVAVVRRRSRLPIVPPQIGYHLWAPTYDADETHNPVLVTERAALAACLPPFRDQAVLDLACGTGHYALQAASAGARLAIGIDRSAGMLRQARDKPAGCRSPVAWVQAEQARLPLASSAFGVVVHALGAGYARDLNPLAGELARMLRPGGTAIVSDLHPQGVQRGWQRTFSYYQEDPDRRASGLTPIFYSFPLRVHPLARQSASHHRGTRRQAILKAYPHRMEDYHAAFEQAGLSIAKVVEPRIDESLRPGQTSEVSQTSEDLARYEQLRHQPLLVVFKLHRTNIEYQMANGKYQIPNGKYQIPNGKYQISSLRRQFDICHLPFDICLNSLWLLAARLASQGLMLVFTVLVARYLGQAGLGQYALIASLVFLGNVLTTFGLDTFLIREVAVQRDNRTQTAEPADQRGIFSSICVHPLARQSASDPPQRSAAATSLAAALGIQLALSAVFIGGVSLASGWLGDVSSTTWALRIYSLSLIPLAFTTTFNASLRAYERMDLILALTLSSAALQTAGAWLLLASGGQLVALSGLLLAVQTLAALAAGAVCYRWLPAFGLDLRVPRALVRQIVRQGIPLVLVAGLAVAYQRMGVLMLSLLAGDAVTGWYAAAARVTDAFKMIHYAFFGAIFPMMSRLAVGGPPIETKTASQRLGVQRLGDLVPALAASRWFDICHLRFTSFWFSLGLGLLAALVTTLLAGPAIRLLYGAGYAPAALALHILAWSLIPFSINMYAFFWLVSQGKESSALKVSAVSAAGAAGLHAILIPAFGLVGAGLATLIGEVMQAVLYMGFGLVSFEVRRVKRKA